MGEWNYSIHLTIILPNFWDRPDFWIWSKEEKIKTQLKKLFIFLMAACLKSMILCLILERRIHGIVLSPKLKLRRKQICLYLFWK